MRSAGAAAIVLSLSACDEMPFYTASEPAPATPASGTALPLSGGTSAEVLDSTSARDRAQAAAAPSGSRLLGTTTASLGTPTEPGFWLKTPLVTQESAGNIRSRSTGETVAVTLIPIEGPPTAGSRVSLAAMRLLDLPLTDLAELDVSLGG